MSGFFLVRGTPSQSSSVLALLMVTYIVCLWWYIRDKERAYGQTAKGHHRPRPAVHRAPPRAPAASTARGDWGRRRRKNTETKNTETTETPQRVGRASGARPSDARATARTTSRRPRCRPVAQGLGRESSKLLSSVTAPWRYVNNVVQELEVRSLFSRPSRPSGTSLSEQDLGGPDVLLAPRESDEYRAPPLRKYGKTSALTQAVVAYARRNSMPLAYFNPHRTPVNNANATRRASFLGAATAAAQRPVDDVGSGASSSSSAAPFSMSTLGNLTFSIGSAASVAPSSSSGASSRPRSGSLPTSYGSFRLRRDSQSLSLTAPSTEPPHRRLRQLSCRELQLQCHLQCLSQSQRPHLQHQHQEQLHQHQLPHHQRQHQYQAKTK
ncbi:hypothetical protein PINS_up019061 [Pythium insidiosum]|nr:hypothetical protein PINS_up019061 [Pythium insidiosum]